MITEELVYYIQNSILTADKIKPQVRDNENIPMPARNLFVSLKSYAHQFFKNNHEPRMVAISGLRGVGKTTLMWQVADSVLRTFNSRIFFISADDLNRLNASIYDVIQVLEKDVLKENLSELSSKMMLLFDEVHEAADWDKDLKILFDKCKSAFILCTGSSSLLLHKSPDLATRWSLLRLFPFSFSEFILTKSWADDPGEKLFPVRQISRKLREILYYADSINEFKQQLSEIEFDIENYFSKIHYRFPKIKLEDLIQEYISYHNIARFLKIENKELILSRILNLFDRIILKDVPHFDTTSADYALIQRILVRLAFSDEINYHSLSKDFRCKETLIESIIESLAKAEILNVFYPHGGIRSKTGQTIKTFFMSPSLRRALFSRIYGPKLETQLRSKLYEDIVAMYLKKSLDPGIVSFGKAEKSKSPDFVIETNGYPVLVEVGSDKTTSIQFDEYGIQFRYGIIINASVKKPTFRKKSVIIPLSWYLLS